jgi:hypothetical protein
MLLIGKGLFGFWLDTRSLGRSAKEKVSLRKKDKDKHSGLFGMTTGKASQNKWGLGTVGVGGADAG